MTYIVLLMPAFYILDLFIEEYTYKRHNFGIINKAYLTDINERLKHKCDIISSTSLAILIGNALFIRSNYISEYTNELFLITAFSLLISMPRPPSKINRIIFRTIRSIARIEKNAFGQELVIINDYLYQALCDMQVQGLLKDGKIPEIDEDKLKELDRESIVDILHRKGIIKPTAHQMVYLIYAVGLSNIIISEIEKVRRRFDGSKIKVVFQSQL